MISGKIFVSTAGLVWRLSDHLNNYLSFVFYDFQTSNLSGKFFVNNFLLLDKSKRVNLKEDLIIY